MSGTDTGYIAPRRVIDHDKDAATVSRPPPPTWGDKYAALSREDLERGIFYWQPRAMAATEENGRLVAAKKAYERLGFWGRLKWLFRSKKRGK